MSRTERLVMQEENFLLGWDAFIDGIEAPAMRCKKDGGIKRVEEAIKIWEKAVKGNPRDGVLTKMIEYAGRIKEQERRRENDEKEREKAAAKTGAPGKAAKGGAKQPQRPSSPSSAASEAQKQAGKRTSLEASYHKQQASAPGVSQP